MPQDPFASLPVVKPKKRGLFDDVIAGSSTSSDDPFARLPVVKKAGAARGAVSAAIQGAAFGFGDEIGGGLNAVFGSGGSASERYRKGRDTVRGVDEEFTQEHPVASVGLNIAGAAVPAIATGGATLVGKGLGTAAKIGAGALEGAGFGGLAGAGNADGGLQSRLKGAALAAPVGALIGGAIPAAGSVVSAIRNVIPKGSSKAVEAARNRLLNLALERDKLNPAKMAQRGADISGKPAMVADLGDENLLGLTRLSANTPSKARAGLTQSLEDRHYQQGARISDDLEKSLGMTRQNVFDVADKLIADRKAAAEPLYKAAYAKGRVDDPEIRKTLELPAFQAALKRGMRLAKTEGVDLLPSTGPEWGEKVQVIDYMKRGMDDLIESKMRSGSMGKSEARALRIRLKDVLERTDAGVPEYKAARAQFAGDKALEDALETGRSFLKEDHRMTERNLAGMSQGEKDMYRVGALDALRNEIDRTKDGADLVKRMFTTPTKRAQLKELIGDDAKFAELEKSFEHEKTMAHTKDAALVGSRTAPMLLDAADAATQGMAVLGHAATGNVAGLAKLGLTSAIKARAQGVSGKVADALGEALQIKPGTPEFNQLIQELEASHAALGGHATRGRIARRALSSGIGGQISR